LSRRILLNSFERETLISFLYYNVQHLDRFKNTKCHADNTFFLFKKHKEKKLCEIFWFLIKHYKEQYSVEEDSYYDRNTDVDCWLPLNIINFTGAIDNSIYNITGMNYIWMASHWLAMSNCMFKCEISIDTSYGITNFILCLSLVLFIFHGGIFTIRSFRSRRRTFWRIESYP
jgi:hypothetical protein